MPADITGSMVWDAGQSGSSSARAPSSRTCRSPTKSTGTPEDLVRSPRVDGRAHRLDRRRDPSALEPFMVIATQNPVEYEGTYPLPEAQLDRFLLARTAAARRRGRDRHHRALPGWLQPAIGPGRGRIRPGRQRHRHQAAHAVASPHRGLPAVSGFTRSSRATRTSPWPGVSRLPHCCAPRAWAFPPGPSFVTLTTSRRWLP